mmetsp:Transcript_39998/g.103326  ORF Transcript_39998/g.103326 Transcript_39998/m.103326 type:complete len:90 (-) Transcript_39998:2956-3225(-)
MGKYCCDDCKKASKLIGKHVSCVEGECGAGGAARKGKKGKKGAFKGKVSKRAPPAGGKKWLEHVRSVKKREGIESWKDALKRAKEVGRA